MSAWDGNYETRRGKNFSIPDNVACSTCEGWGSVVIDRQTDCYREVKTLNCEDCCGTGLAPIPLGEVT